ncbi:helix-turn-helix domain-containing protein [Mycolicibacterium gilvum]
MLRRCGVDARIDTRDPRKLIVEATQSVRVEGLSLGLPQLAKQRARVHIVYDSLETLNEVRRSDQINRTRWALEVLGDQARRDLLETGRLRIDHPDISLDELGQMMEPPATRHTMCGRLRRLHQEALKRASDSPQP